jgi:hypothetical protein
MRPWNWVKRRFCESAFKSRRDGRFEYRGIGPPLWAHVVTADEKAAIEARLSIPLLRRFLLAFVAFAVLYGFLISRNRDNAVTALPNALSLCALFGIWVVLWGHRHLAGVPRLETPDIQPKGNIWIRLLVRAIVRQQETKVLGFALSFAAFSGLMSIIWVAKFNAGKYGELYEWGTWILFPVTWSFLAVLLFCFRPRIGSPGVPLEARSADAPATAKQRLKKEERSGF